ncbi:uncharacterized protein LY79DRAFT_508089 [Colletotrichum navitas]|uniref:Utp8 beta-propeller domain-containing protein n=1 Tax=Colletotrichum navitas TaxID=681940 RepID=A0AAD8Q8B3_9PEZI|nr:uncharacterized protein LY79DRAFT_508089 [Colletotrichum navitas]KAK1597086.1 hypothetical protein LY79DRAFT_508089 [Colletotrichum navitas]
MAPTFRIHRPDVLASLPRPLDHTKGQYHIGEVYAQKPGSKKRKRLEVVVGVDGEAANIYHVPSSGLRTSYPIPPQESFTCAPYSIRYQGAGASGRNNYTYLSTQDSTGAKITLCRDAIDVTGKTNSTSTSQRVRHKHPITYLFTSSAIDTTVVSDAPQSERGDVLGLCKDGQVLCLDGEALEQKWSAASYSLCKDLLPSTVSGYEVEFSLHAAASEVLNGLFQGRQDAFGSFGRQIDPKTFNPDVLAIIVRADSEDTISRFLIILGVLPTVTSQPLVQLHVTPLPSQDDVAAELATYQLHIQSGKLLQLSGAVLRTYDLTSAVPKLQGRLPLPELTSFLQLSEHSVLCLSQNSASMVNPTFHSVQASTAIQLPESTEQQKPTLITFLSKLDMAVAVVGSTLVSIQIERPKSHSKEGLLIDSIGRGLPRSDRVPASLPKTGDSTFENYLPGTLSDEYVKESLADVEKADGYLLAQDWKAFEGLLAQRFGVAIDQDAEVTGVQTPDWKWLDSSDKYPAVDRRWVLYAISRVFSMDTQAEEGGLLRCMLPASNVMIYLIAAGHLTNANMSAAFRSELVEAASKETIIDKLVQRLVDMDPAMELLLNYVSATKLGEKELLLVIRIIMRSLDQQSRLLLPAPTETKEEEYVAMEIDHLEKELEMAEYHLGDDTNLRARTLTTAFEKLSNYSSVATVRALRETFNPTEVLSLIHLLRVQLIGSAWTSRYVDSTNFDKDEAARAPPDSAISLIAELLSRCIDSVGPSGWLTNGTSLGDRADATDFITALKLEVSAALEGLNEAVYLDGIVGEAVQYGRAVKAGVKTAPSGRAQALAKPVSLDVESSPHLPLGLVSKQSVSNVKIVSGGEVLERSSREKGHLLSQKVKAYSLERISI